MVADLDSRRGVSSPLHQNSIESLACAAATTRDVIVVWGRFQVSRNAATAQVSVTKTSSTGLTREMVAEKHSGRETSVQNTYAGFGGRFRGLDASSISIICLHPYRH